MAKHAQQPKKTRRFHLASKDREYLTTNIAQLLKAAVPVGEALDSLAETSRSRMLKRALEQIRHDIDDGLPFWRALERSGIVSEQSLALIRLGEQSGSLVDNLTIAARQEQKQQLFRTKIRSALIYPIFVLSLTGIIGLGVAWFLLPKLSETFSELRLNLPLISRLFIDLGLFLKRDGIWVVPLLLTIGFFLLYVLFVAPKTKQIGNMILFHIPGIAGLLYEVEIARFGYLLGTLLEAGLSVTQSFELLERSTGARRYQRFYFYLRHSFEEGYGFKTSFKQYRHSTKLIPPAVQQMLLAGERSGSLPEILHTVADTYEQKSDIATQNLEVILEPILLVIVATGVLGVAIAVILPIYKLVGGLNQ